MISIGGEKKRGLGIGDFIRVNINPTIDKMEVNK